MKIKKVRDKNPKTFFLLKIHDKFLIIYDFLFPHSLAEGRNDFSLSHLKAESRNDFLIKKIPPSSYSVHIYFATVNTWC